MAVTFNAPTFTASELEAAQGMVAYLKVKQVIIDGLEFNNNNFLKNDLLRCYYCKRERFAFLAIKKNEWGKKYIVEGSHLDDLNEYRPGMKAVKEFGVISPFIQAGITRSDIEDMAGFYQLPFNNRKSESCLATRIKTGQKLELDVLMLIGEAEAFIKNLGIGLVRARWDEGAINLEFEAAELEKAFSLRELMVPHLKEMGFKSVGLNLEGYVNKNTLERKDIDG